MNIDLLRQVIRQEAPSALVLGTVVSADPRGTHDLAVRLSGGRVCRRAGACVTGLQPGDQVLVAKTKDRPCVGCEQDRG